MISHLACSRCHAPSAHTEVQHLCRCGAPLLVRYDFEAARVSLTPEALSRRPPTIWRYRELLPLTADEAPLTLGEGCTPLLHATRLGGVLGLTNLLIKDESQNPTGSFKARGMAVALAKARALGVSTVCLPTNGNAGAAAAAYAALAGMEAHVFVPEGTPPVFEAAARAVGGQVSVTGRSIAEARQELGRVALSRKWYDLSTFHEPYRVEGKKTIGFELLESLGRLPEAIVYPVGGGTGIVGLWKAFDELEALGWIGRDRPRMYAVQAAGCAPLVHAFEAGRTSSSPWPEPRTRALGLCVPGSRADFLILNILRASSGGGVAVGEDQISEGQQLLGREGLFASPESGPAAAGLQVLAADGRIGPAETVVLFHTASGGKYAAAPATESEDVSDSWPPGTVQTAPDVRRDRAPAESGMADARWQMPPGSTKLRGFRGHPHLRNFHRSSGVYGYPACGYGLEAAGL